MDIDVQLCKFTGLRRDAAMYLCASSLCWAGETDAPHPHMLPVLPNKLLILCLLLGVYCTMETPGKVGGLLDNDNGFFTLPFEVVHFRETFAI